VPTVDTQRHLRTVLKFLALAAAAVVFSLLLTHSTSKTMTVVVTPSVGGTRSLPVAEEGETRYILNMRSRRFHLPECVYAPDEDSRNRSEFCGTAEAVIAIGYTPCKNCLPELVPTVGTD